MAGHHAKRNKQFDEILSVELKSFLDTGKSIDGNVRTLAAEIYDKYPSLRRKNRDEDIDNIRGRIRTRLQKNGSVHAKNLINKKFLSMIQSDKKKGITDYREMFAFAKKRKELHKKASWTQSEGSVKITTNKEWIVVQPISDTHIGAFGTDYDKLLEYTEFIKKTPNLYTCLLGDMTDHFVNFRNMAAVHGQVLSPQEQRDVFESWVADIEQKILFATWCNHSEFEEKQTGFNSIKAILERKSIYFNGIGVCNVKVNNTSYSICATHKTRYFSSFNLTHGLMQMARKDVQGKDIYIGGDKHEPSLTQAPVGGKISTFIQLGTLKMEDVYSKRYFSYTTNPEMPCFALNAKTKKIVPFVYLEDALNYIK